jgi:hypothetical protein
MPPLDSSDSEFSCKEGTEMLSNKIKKLHNSRREANPGSKSTGAHTLSTNKPFVVLTASSPNKKESSNCKLDIVYSARKHNRTLSPPPKLGTVKFPCPPEISTPTSKNTRSS